MSGNIVARIEEYAERETIARVWYALDCPPNTWRLRLFFRLARVLGVIS